MLHGIMSARFQDVVETYDVALDIHVRVLDGVPNPRLGSEVDHHVEVILGKETVNESLVGNAAPDELIVDSLGSQGIQFL